MDVGTAKPTLAERRGVVHHGLDLVDPDEDFSVPDFAAHARPASPRSPSGMASRSSPAAPASGCAPSRPGWTSTRPRTTPALRARLEAELAADGLAALAARLRSVAPALADRTDLRNPRRVVRALEVAMLRGDGPPPPPAGYPGPVAWIVLDVADRALHRSWIAARAVGQLDGGLPEEAARLRARYGEALRSFTAIGYREAFDLLDGRMDRDGFLATNVGRNAAFARRQRTWFRAERDITWLDPSTRDPLDAALAIARASSPRPRAGPARPRRRGPGPDGPAPAAALSFTS